MGRMTSINSFYLNPNAARYAETLFARPAASVSSSSSFSAEDRSATTETAGQRALSRIIAILSLSGPDGSGNSATVDERLGYVTTASGTDGNDSLTFSARGLFDVETGAGDDSLTVKAGAVNAVSTGDGKDTIKAQARAITDIDGGAGDDDMQFIGTLLMGIQGGEGNDTIKASGQALIGIDGGAGNDTLYLEGNRIFASGGTGDDVIDIHQTGTNPLAELGFAAGDGKDKVTTDGALSIRLSGYTADDAMVSTANGKLTLTFKGSSDSITVSLTGKDQTGSAPSWHFTTDQGQTVLRIG